MDEENYSHAYTMVGQGGTALRLEKVQFKLGMGKGMCLHSKSNQSGGPGG